MPIKSNIQIFVTMSNLAPVCDAENENQHDGIPEVRWLYRKCDWHNHIQHKLYASRSCCQLNLICLYQSPSSSEHVNSNQDFYTV